MTTTIKDLLTAIKDANVGENDGVQVETDTETFYDLQFDRKNNALAIHVKDDRDLQGTIDDLEEKLDAEKGATLKARELLAELLILIHNAPEKSLSRPLHEKLVLKIKAISDGLT